MIKKYVFISALFFFVPNCLSVINLSLKSSQEEQFISNWIDNMELANNYSFAPKHNTVHKVYQDKQIDIAFDYDLSPTIVNIYAKSVDKNYYLKINKNNLIEKQSLIKQVINKFYQDQVQRQYISSNDFFILTDTQNRRGGKIIKNERINFNSSWGVWNSQEVENEFELWFDQDLIISHILALNKNHQIPKNSKIGDIEIQPNEINILPIAKIYQTPIGYAKWITNYIKNGSRSFSYLDDEQNLMLPEGHNNGAEWWRGLTSAFVFVGSIVLSLLPIGGLISSAFARLAINKGLTFFIKGITLLAFNMGSNLAFKFIDDYFNTPKEANINKEQIQKIFKNIFKTIKEKSKSIWVYQNTYQNLKNQMFISEIAGTLIAGANATSIWGRKSEMQLERAFGALSADVRYNVYK